MGQYERIDADTGLPMRRLSIPQRDGGERGFWVYDASDPAIASWVQAGVTAIASTAAFDEDMAFVESIQYWPDDAD